jgi:hypothetical protein
MRKQEKGSEQAKAWVEKALAVTWRRYGGAAEQLVSEIMRDL